MIPTNASRLSRLFSLIPLCALCVCASVEAAPKGDKGGKPPAQLRILSASYDGVLTLSGDRAERNTSISVSNANPAIDQSWTTSSDRRGKWGLDVDAPQPVPCRVSVSVSDGVSQAETEVIGAPADCDGNLVVNTPPTAADDTAQTDADLPLCRERDPLPAEQGPRRPHVPGLSRYQW